MNTVIEPTLIMTVTNATILDANGALQSGDTLTWHLPDLLPQASDLITVTIAAPPVASDFVEMDAGAVVNGTLWGEVVSAAARPTTVIPDGLDPAFVMTTIDADAGDADMLWAAAAFTQEPFDAFALVRSFGWDPYEGSLRGTRGTLWGEGGNSLDQASLLIAFLRSAGVPARYRHGSLDLVGAETLLSSMFSANEGFAGYLAPEADLADPLNDPDLLAMAQDHWWVEAYLPALGWTDMDPTFPGALLGEGPVWSAGEG